MSVKQNFPVIRPTLNLDFAGSQSVDSRIQFTRASAATLTDAQGILKTVRDNKPRIDFDPSTGECKGLLIEEQRTNLYSRSGYPHLWDTLNASIIPNADIAPDGTMSATLITAVNTDPFWYQTVSSLPGNVTVSVWVKATGTAIGKTGTIRISGNAVTTPAFTTSWQRITASFNVTGTYIVGFEFPDSGAAVGDKVYVWGAQVEAGTFATSYVPSIPTFTSRASSATYFDSTGVLRTAPTNGARYGFGYDTTTQKWISQGLILESAATNLFPTSLMSAFAAVQNMDIVSTSIAAIDGTVGNVFKLTPNATNTGMHSIFRNLASSTPSTRCVSVYLKAAGYNYVRIYCDGTDPTVGGVVYDLSTGTTSIHSSYTGANRLAYGMENVGNGWYRCWMSGTATNADWYYHIDVANTAAFGSFAGDGSSGVYAWGPQMEIGSRPTSYIATSGSTVTRAADVSTSAATTRASDSAIINGKNFSSWYNSNAGTLYSESISYKTNYWNSAVMLTDDTVSGYSITNRSFIEHVYYTGGSNLIQAEVITNGGTSFSGWHGTDRTKFTKIASGHDSSGFGSSANGSTPITSGTNPLPVKINSMYIGAFYVAYDPFVGHIKKITYYPQRISNAQLQALTV